MKNFSFIDLFAGIGGMRIPFEELGGKCIFSSENDIHARKTYSKMFNEVNSRLLSLKLSAFSPVTTVTL